MKKIIVLIAICTVGIYSEVDAGRVRRFIGGQNARFGQYPYMVSLRNSTDEEHFCGGSIIHHKFILTAAHCLQGLSLKDFYAIVGTTLLSTKPKKYYVANYYIHGRYKNTTYKNDIGLLKLMESVKFSNTIQKISLHSTGPPVGHSVSICGWGMSTFSFENMSMSYNLKCSNMTVISLQKCRKEYKVYQLAHKTINKRNICTYDDKIIKGICFGDSGGPLVYNGKQVGIVSWSAGCGLYPDVSLKVSAYTNWIEATMKKMQIH